MAVSYTASVQLQEAKMSPFGETLRRARVAKKITFEDAERATRISRRYLQAMEQEEFGILPAPVYARGFLRSYASYLGLNPSELLPMFPVGEVEEQRLAPLPKVRGAKSWSMGGLIPVVALGLLVLLVIALYSIGLEESSGSLSRARSAVGDAVPEAALTSEGQTVVGASSGPVFDLPDLTGISLAQATATIEETGASYVIIGVHDSDVPTGQVVGQLPGPGTPVGRGDFVTLVVSR